jgi:hypothetical protein
MQTTIAYARRAYRLVRRPSDDQCPVLADIMGGSMPSSRHQCAEFDAARNIGPASKPSKAANSRRPRSLRECPHRRADRCQRQFPRGLADAGLNDFKAAAKHYERATKANKKWSKPTRSSRSLI